MGAVADDGGTMVLNGNTITTLGPRSIGLFTVTEQVGSQFPANSMASGVTVETFGSSAHGVAAQARNDLPVGGDGDITNSSVTTHGDRAVGLRATLGDYGTRPIQGRGEAAVIANGSTVSTEGFAAHGALSRDSPISVTMNQTSVSRPATLQGSVAEAAGALSWTPAAERDRPPAAGHVTGTRRRSIRRPTGNAWINSSGPTIGAAPLPVDRPPEGGGCGVRARRRWDPISRPDAALPTSAYPNLTHRMPVSRRPAWLRAPPGTPKVESLSDRRFYSLHDPGSRAAPGQNSRPGSARSSTVTFRHSAASARALASTDAATPMMENSVSG